MIPEDLMKEDMMMKAIGLDLEPNKSFFYENAFYLTSKTDRMAKFLAHYEFFKMTEHLAGDIVECGVFKGASLARFIKFRNIFSPGKKVVGFDTFGEFPESEFEKDVSYRENFIKSAGSKSVPREGLMKLLKGIGCSDDVELIEGDVCDTIPAYISKNPDFSISLLNVDVDIYKPTKAVLDLFYDRVVNGGIVVLDDYKGFPGATSAIDEFCKARGIEVRSLKWLESPYYIKK
jgi:hypothetical protein